MADFSIISDVSNEVLKLLRENMRDKSIAYHWHDPNTSFLEAVFSRGDRRLADVYKNRQPMDPFERRYPEIKPVTYRKK